MGNVSDNAQSTAMNMMAIAQQFQDQMIAKRLPGWMGKVRTSDFTLLRDALAEGLQSRQRLAKCWSKIESLDSFCITRLNTALQETFDTGLDAKQHFLRQWYTYTSLSTVTTPATTRRLRAIISTCHCSARQCPTSARPRLPKAGSMRVTRWSMDLVSLSRPPRYWSLQGFAGNWTWEGSTRATLKRYSRPKSSRRPRTAKLC